MHSHKRILGVAELDDEHVSTCMERARALIGLSNNIQSSEVELE